MSYIVDTLRRERLIDELIEAYVGWREACVRVRDAYRLWAGDTGPDSGLAFGLYRAALDEEQHAAEIYARFVRRAEKLPSSTDPPARPAEHASQDSVTAHRSNRRWPRTKEQHDSHPPASAAGPTP
jgi:hypothetical protein